MPAVTCSDPPQQLAIPPAGFVRVDTTVINVTIFLGDAFCLPKSANVAPSQLACTDLGQPLIAVTASNRAGTVIDGCPVKLSDFISPTARCTNASLVLSSAGKATLSAGTIDSGSTDQCLIVAHAVVPSEFGCADALASPVPVQLTVTDQSGNSGSCAALVQVRDTTAPLIACQPSFNVAGPTQLTLNEVLLGASDACGATVSFAPSFVPCLSPQPVTVVVTAVDPSGNRASCSLQVACVTTTATTATDTTTSTTTATDTTTAATPTTAPTVPCDPCDFKTVTATQTEVVISNHGPVFSFALFRFTITDGPAQIAQLDDPRCNRDLVEFTCRLPAIGPGGQYTITYQLRDLPPGGMTTIRVQLSACEDRLLL